MAEHDEDLATFKAVFGKDYENYKVGLREEKLDELLDAYNFKKTTRRAVLLGALKRDGFFAAKQSG